MHIVGECHGTVFPYAKLWNELLSPEYNIDKDTSAMVGEMYIIAAKALLAKIQYEKKHGGASVKCWWQIMLG